MSDACDYKKLKVIIQENGIVRSEKGTFLGRLSGEVLFEGINTSNFFDFSIYQEGTAETWISTGESNDLARLALGVADEAGEVAGKIKKCFRGDAVPKEQLKEDLKKELGDVLYYVARLADHFGLSLEEIAQANYAKLIDRKQRGVLKGSGDNR